jgi:copper chaperone CopZ
VKTLVSQFGQFQENLRANYYTRGEMDGRIEKFTTELGHIKEEVRRVEGEMNEKINTRASAADMQFVKDGIDNIQNAPRLRLQLVLTIVSTIGGVVSTGAIIISILHSLSH